MGCDGGTIPTRDELVRTKKKPEQKDKNAELVAKWKHCAISQEPLRTPIMACELGRLYNKESVIEFLIDRSQFEMAASFAHLRGLKDVKELKLTDNPDRQRQKADRGEGYVDTQTSPYICPVTGLEMSGRYRFSVMWSCGCVLSKRALKEVKSDVCHKCGETYQEADVVSLNGDEGVVEEMKSRMDARRALAKLNKVKKVLKKSKAGSKHKNASAVSDDAGCTSTKQPKIDTDITNDPSAKTKPDQPIASTSSKFVASNTDVEKFTRQDKNPNGKHKNSKDKNADKIGKDKSATGRNIQSDPTASKAYKSLFTSSSAAKSQASNHWVTYNPMYY